MKKEIYFVSYTAKDEHIATWIAGTLEEHGQTVRIQVWDIEPGDNFFSKMHEFLIECDVFVPIYSHEYFDSFFCKEEWTNALTSAVNDKKKRVVPIRIADVEPDGILKGRVYIDLSSIYDENEAEKELLQGIGLEPRPRFKPPYQNPFSKPTTAVKDGHCSSALIDVTKTFDNRTVSIRNIKNNKYLGADKDQPDTPIFAHVSINGRWEQFEVKVTQDGWAVFKACNNGKYISVQEDMPHKPLFASAENIGDWECFLIFSYKGNFVLKTRESDMFIMPDIDRSITLGGNVGLYAYVHKPGEWEQFQIEIIE